MLLADYLAIFAPKALRGYLDAIKIQVGLASAADLATDLAVILRSDDGKWDQNYQLGLLARLFPIQKYLVRVPEQKILDLVKVET
jgi:hypothetical protein